MMQPDFYTPLGQNSKPVEPGLSLLELAVPLHVILLLHVSACTYMLGPDPNTSRRLINPKAYLTSDLSAHTSHVNTWLDVCVWVWVFVHVGECVLSLL